MNGVAVDQPYELKSGDTIRIFGESVVWDDVGPMGNLYTSWDFTANGATLDNGGKMISSGDIHIIGTENPSGNNYYYPFSTTINYE